MATNKRVRDSLALAAVAAAVLLTVTVNILADKKFWRADLTSEGRYSVSMPFRRILERLKYPAKLTYYISGAVPAHVENVKRDILDTLREIETAAAGKLKLEVVDPTGDTKLLDLLEQKNGRITTGEHKNEQYTLAFVYSAIKIVYGAKGRVPICPINSPADLEYALGSELAMLTLDEKPLVTLNLPMPPGLDGRAEQRMQTGFEWINSKSQKTELTKFNYRYDGLSETSVIPDKTALLVLVQPEQLHERQQYEVIRHLASGGKVLLLTSPVKTTRNASIYALQQINSGLETYLKSLGVTIDSNMIADVRCVQSKGVNPGPFPTLVQLLPQNMNQQSGLTRMLPSFFAPMPAAIEFDDTLLSQNGLLSEVLATTSEQSWTIPFKKDFYPERPIRDNLANKKFEGRKNVLVALTGQFPFPYEGAPIPEWPRPQNAEPDTRPKSKPPLAKIDAKPGMLIICSAPDAFSQYHTLDPDNGADYNERLFFNLLEHLTTGDDLSKIRTKQYETRSIDTLPGKEQDAKRNLIKFALVFGVPLLVVLFALTRSLLRRRAQHQYERKLAATSGPSSFTP
jgi:ABC-type uncharacterized transport system involved in gliding motility auxiliary subunit